MRRDRREYNKLYYVKNRDKLLAYGKSYYHKNRDTCLAKANLWDKQNREKVSIRKRSRYALDHEFRERVKTINKAYHREFPTRKKEAWLKKAYGLSLKDRDDLLASQGGLCKLCNRHIQFTVKQAIDAACVDHDHKTNVVRGLLCTGCNLSLGHFETFLSRFGLEKLNTYLAQGKN